MPVRPFVELADRPDYWLRRARIPACLIAGEAPGPKDGDGLVNADLRVTAGRIAALAPLGTAPAEATDLAGGMVFPAFVDLHTHLDKGHIWPRAQNADGTFMGAIEAVMKDKLKSWRADDVERRFDFSLRAAYAHGTAAIRTHIDSNAENAETSWTVFRRLREAWRGRIELQAASILPVHFFTEAWAPKLAEIVARSEGAFGLVTRFDVDRAADMPADFDALLDRFFALAEQYALPLDLHVDETGRAGSAALLRIARTAARRKFKGRIVAGHCCSLAMQSDAEIETTLDAVREAGIAVVGLPMCNLYLQDRVPGRTPRWRGVTLLHEMKARGIPVALASDNTRDPFYGYGDLDMFEVYAQATRIAHLDRPFGDWPMAATATPAAIMGLTEAGRIAVGGPADLVLFKARAFSELLSRPQADRAVIRAGRAIDTNPPDYAELDDLFAG